MNVLSAEAAVPFLQRGTAQVRGSPPHNELATRALGLSCAQEQSSVSKLLPERREALAAWRDHPGVIGAGTGRQRGGRPMAEGVGEQLANHGDGDHRRPHHGGCWQI